MTVIKRTIFPIILFFVFGFTNLQAQEEKVELEQAMQNPIAAISVLPFQNNTQLGYYNYVVKPDNGPDWQLRAQINLLFPKK